MVEDGRHPGEAAHGDAHGMHMHAPRDIGRAFMIGIALNAGFVVAEVAAGVLGHSMALLADAGHNLGDVLSLAVAAGAGVLARRRATARFTYGLGSTSILAALFNAVLLLLVVGALSWEALGRLFHPEPVEGGIVMAVAGAGIAVNGICAWLFARGRGGDLNVRGAFMHMAGDALVSAGVLIAGFVIAVTGWTVLDPLVTLAVNAVIVAGTWGLLRDSAAMALAAVPPDLDPEAIRRFLAAQPGVASLHDLHVWSLSTTETALTVHLVMPGGHPGDAFLQTVSDALAARFRVRHPTVQVETGAQSCGLADHAP